MPPYAEIVQNCKASSVSWRLDGRENAGPAEQACRVNRVRFDFRQRVDL